MYKIILYCSFIISLYLLQGCTADAGRKMPSLAESYSNADTKPFGGYIAYQQLQAMYSQNIIREKKQSFTKTWDDISYLDTASLYVCLAPNLYVNDEEVTAMMDYVAAGNDLFIAAGNIDDQLLKKVGCKESYDIFSNIGSFEQMDNTSVSLPAAQPPAFSYYYLPFGNSFSGINKTNTRILGFNDYKSPDFIVRFYGKGKLFLHCGVKAFSNYFLLKDNNYKYLQNALTYTRRQPAHLYWDDYYNKLRYRRDSTSGGFSSFSEIAKYPPLLTAFWLAIIALLLYIIFAAKRRQRIIKTIKPNENSTVNFTETVGRLYLQKKDNKNIAEKMITYFNEYIRNNYFLNTGNINDDFITTLSRKSGVQRDKVDALYRTIQHTQQTTELDDYQLLSLNELIQNFYKKINN